MSVLQIHAHVTCHSLQVVGFPTMMFVRNNVMTTYTGDRDIHNLKAYARSVAASDARALHLLRCAVRKCSGALKPEPNLDQRGLAASKSREFMCAAA